MAAIVYKAFLSCSFAPEDANVLAFFDRLVRALDIEPHVYNYQGIGRIPDKIKEHIADSDCLIAIATRRHKMEGADVWTCPDWIHHEVALANAFKKPVAVFNEDGVKLEGLIATEERRQVFSRNAFLTTVLGVVRFLFNLRTYLDSVYRIERLHLPVMLRHFVHIRKKRSLTRCWRRGVRRPELVLGSSIQVESAHSIAARRSLRPGSTPGRSAARPSVMRWGW